MKNEMGDWPSHHNNLLPFFSEGNLNILSKMPKKTQKQTNKKQYWHIWFCNKQINEQRDTYHINKHDKSYIKTWTRFKTVWQILTSDVQTSAFSVFSLPRHNKEKEKEEFRGVEFESVLSEYEKYSWKSFAKWT